MTDPGALFASLRHTLLETLRPIVAGRDVALLDVPDHANVGDSAIWLGERACLHALGARVRYACVADALDRAALERHVGAGPLLLHGGGNLGDLWPRYQHFREAVVTMFRDRPIVQLSQSMHFDDPGALARAQRVFADHPDLTILARERQTLERAADAFRRARVLLCPDAAFALEPHPRPLAPRRQLLWLARSDHEAMPRPRARGAPERADWTEEHGNLSALARWLGRPGRRIARWRWQVRLPLLSALARRRVERGERLLSSARTVITDRLHAHILCLRLGIPHVVLDNRTGKLASFRATWTSDCPLARWADTEEQAVTIASQLA